MIECIEFKNPVRYTHSYIADIFKEDTKITFNPGVNIIIGPNGCGKSTIIKCLSEYTLCSNTMYSCYDSLHVKNYMENINWLTDEHHINDGITVKADYNRSTFRWKTETGSNNDEVMHDIYSFRNYGIGVHSSDGEKNLIAFQELFNIMFDSNKYLKFPKIQDDRIKEYYTANHIDSNRYTILMDEPDKSLDMDNIMQVYNILNTEKEDTQIIAVIHNPILIYKLSLNKNINIIQLQEGYLSKIINFIKTK